MLADTLRAVERFLLPNACVGCRGPVEPHQPDALVCSRCRWRMRVITGGCPRCGQPDPPIGPCRVCPNWPPELRWVRSAVWLGPEARAVVHGLKYGGLSHLGMFAAELIARAVRQPPEGLLLPVPLTAARRRHRGYNQALVIARALGTRWSLPVVEGVLLRPGTATSQTQVRAGSRGANVAGAFLATAPPQRPGAGAGSPPAVIIVDDVFTTGATVQAAATALVEAGWRNLGAVTWARAMPIEFRIL